MFDNGSVTSDLGLVTAVHRVDGVPLVSQTANSRFTGRHFDVRLSTDMGLSLSRVEGL